MAGGETTDGLESGTPTLHARADAWECDFNGHWNTRYYCRTFQTAAEVGAALHGQQDTASVIPSGWHVRFHRELGGGDPIVVRSYQAQGQGTHVLTCHGAVSATAIAYGLPEHGFPPLPVDLAPRVLPRGLTDAFPDPWTPDPSAEGVVELGPVQSGETYSDGTLRIDVAAAKLAIPTHHHAMRIGFTLELAEERGIGRMLVELRYRPIAPCSTGTFLRGVTKTTRVEGKAFTTANMLYGHDGMPVAMFELCTLAVDLNTRRAIDVPDFIARV